MRILPATLDHVSQVAEEMRDCDRQEVWAASGHSPGVALHQSMKSSPSSFAAVTDDGNAFAIFGCTPLLLPGVGSPWMLATDRLYDHPRWVGRVTRDCVDIFHGIYPVLLNYVDARNRASIRWLQWAGFTIGPALPYGVQGLPFHPFTKVSHV